MGVGARCVVGSWVVGAIALGCGGNSQVSFVSNERPSAYGAPQGVGAPGAARANEHPNGANELPNDDETIEPEHPVMDTKQERALVHIHGPKDVCSGVVVAPRVVATAQQCLHGIGKGVTALGPDREYRVEVPSSALTWTNRRAKYAILPACDAAELDVALLVLADPIDWVQPLRIVSAPDTGARVQALGFGRCTKQNVAMKERVGVVRSRVSGAVVIDVPLCRGDMGGPVVDGRDGDVIGLISRRDDPEGSPLRTTTIARLDTSATRDLLGQAKTLVDGGDAQKLAPVACR